jgi:hypothetical protein
VSYRRRKCGEKPTIFSVRNKSGTVEKTRQKFTALAVIVPDSLSLYLFCLKEQSSTFEFLVPIQNSTKVIWPSLNHETFVTLIEKGS